MTHDTPAQPWTRNAHRTKVPKHVRFEVLRRDGFRCRYCGAVPDETQLVVDHVHPVKYGGSNAPENLVAACADCNGGKNARLLDDPPAPDVDAAADIVHRVQRAVMPSPLLWTMRVNALMAMGYEAADIEAAAAEVFEEDWWGRLVAALTGAQA